MATVQESIEVAVPVSTAYNQWTQFESFPQFMEGVDSVTQLDDKRNHWKTHVAGVEKEFDTEIVDQRPDERIAWQSIGGVDHSGVVTFDKLDAGTTRVNVQFEWDPESFKEKVGSAVGADNRQVKKDLERFKEFIEGRGAETGAWRGEVEGGQEVSGGVGGAGLGGATAAGVGLGAAGMAGSEQDFNDPDFNGRSAAAEDFTAPDAAVTDSDAVGYTDTDTGYASGGNLVEPGLLDTEETERGYTEDGLVNPVTDDPDSGTPRTLP
ncbi:SRPBCC family protein [Arthrobacter sp. CG_A4]|uniref:SRPBCC family protein n=1 Tax=Arthrobacter sp. CG_A4 TaxID=3071706 RepID=UPI002E03FBAD|nr:putative membrane protein [Arthrobacter sp. CG_A4]